MRAIVLAILMCSLNVYAKDNSGCETHKVTFSVPNSSSSVCRNIKLVGTHNLKVCENKKGTLTVAGGRSYFIFAAKNLWKFHEELYDFSSLTVETESLSLDLENKSFNYVTEKRKKDGTVLKKTVCDGILEVKN